MKKNFLYAWENILQAHPCKARIQGLPNLGQGTGPPGSTELGWGVGRSFPVTFLLWKWQEGPVIWDWSWDTKDLLSKPRVIRSLMQIKKQIQKG